MSDFFEDIGARVFAWVPCSSYFQTCKHHATTSNSRPGHVQDINTFNTYPRRFLPATFICRASPKSLMSVVLRFYQLGAPDHPGPWSLPRKAGFVGLVVFSSTQAMHPQLLARSKMYQDPSCLALALYMVVTSQGGQASRGIHKSPPKVATKSKTQSQRLKLKLLRQTQSKKR